MTVLHERATLLSVTGKAWRGSGENKMAGEELATLKNTTTDWVTVYQRTVSKDVIRGPLKIWNGATNHLRGLSPGAFDREYLPGGLPYWDKGVFIMPNVLGEKVKRNLGASKDQFDDAVEVVRRALPEALRQARIENPKLFDQVTLPSIDDICDNRFAFDYDFTLIPSTGDIRVEGSRAWAAEVTRRTTAKAERKLVEVTNSSGKAIVKVARRIVKACEDHDPKGRGKSPLGEVAVNSVRELIPIAQGLNINNDARIDKALTDLLVALGNKSAGDLRVDEAARQQVAADVRRVADNMDSLFNS